MMRPEDVGKILEICRRDVEVTLEANPSDIVHDRGKLEGFVNAGVNRISLGIQVLIVSIAWGITYLHIPHLVETLLG